MSQADIPWLEHEDIIEKNLEAMLAEGTDDDRLLKVLRMARSLPPDKISEALEMPEEVVERIIGNLIILDGRIAVEKRKEKEDSETNASANQPASADTPEDALLSHDAETPHEE